MTLPPFCRSLRTMLVRSREAALVLTYFKYALLQCSFITVLATA